MILAQGQCEFTCDGILVSKYLLKAQWETIHNYVGLSEVFRVGDGVWESSCIIVKSSVYVCFLGELNIPPPQPYSWTTYRSLLGLDTWTHEWLLYFSHERGNRYSPYYSRERNLRLWLSFHTISTQGRVTSYVSWVGKGWFYPGPTKGAWCGPLASITANVSMLQ